VLEAETKRDPAARAAQKRLADEVTALVHGAAEAEKAKAAATALFSGGAGKLSAAQLKSALAEAPSSQRDKNELAGEGVALVDLLAESGLCGSKGAARKDVTGGGIYLNDERVQDAALRVKADDLIDGELLVLRKGKKTYHLITYR
jgi:tyrosyl-tRNA synthetase